MACTRRVNVKSTSLVTYAVANTQKAAEPYGGRQDRLLIELWFFIKELRVFIIPNSSTGQRPSMLAACGPRCQRCGPLGTLPEGKDAPAGAGLILFSIPNRLQRETVWGFVYHGAVVRESRQYLESSQQGNWTVRTLLVLRTSFTSRPRCGWPEDLTIRDRLDTVVVTNVTPNPFQFLLDALLSLVRFWIGLLCTPR